MNLQAFLDRLDRAGELQRVRCKMNPVHELGLVCRRAQDAGGPALLFERVEGSNVSILANLFGTRRRLAHFFGVPEAELAATFRERARPDAWKPPVLQSTGPCQEVVRLGSEADLAAFPHPIWNQEDCGPYINFGLIRAQSPDGTIANVSVNRLQVKGRDRLGTWTTPERDLGQLLQMTHRQGASLPVAIWIGGPPAAMIAAVCRPPFGSDELHLAGGLQGEGVAVVRCKTSALTVPADAEIVIEGEIIPGETEPDGPYAEWMGYVGAAVVMPVIRVTAITCRANPLYVGSYEGRPDVEHHVLGNLDYENAVRTIVEQAGIRVQDVAVLPGSGGLAIAIAIHKTMDSDPKQAMFAAFTARLAKHVIIVDHDVDPRDPRTLNWVMSTRVRYDRDLVLVPESWAMPMDPSTDPQPGGGPFRTTTKVGIDATRPPGPFPQVIRFSPDLAARVSARWREYGFSI